MNTRLTTAAPYMTFTIALVVYLLTLAPGLTQAHFGGDGGELITAAVTGGVPHPQGYPTYSLLGSLLRWLPLGTVAYRFNLFSAVCMAATAAIISQIAKDKGSWGLGAGRWSSRVGGI